MMIRSTTLVCLAVLLPLLVCASYGRNDDYGGGSSGTKVKANKAEPVVHVGGNAAEGADVKQWDAGTARVVAQDFDAYDAFAAAVQSVKHAVQHMFSTVGGLVLVSCRCLRGPARC
jgi:hypothetical protein